MKLDVRLTRSIPDVGPAARRYEAAGYAGGWVAEKQHDPFLTALVAAQETTTMQIGTSIVVAFARSPMTVAMSANDLQRASAGRFVLGLGTQVKPHIERRYSMPWSAPAARMREYILALHAIWDAWNEGTRLDFRGRFYRHDLMTPFFSPAPNPCGRPKVFLAGVGPLMTEVAGSVADGFFSHGFTTVRYLREVTLPLLRTARTEAGRDMADFDVAGAFFVATGPDDESMDKAVRGIKEQIAFYASTPAYRGILDLHGWGDIQPALNALVKGNRWGEMADLVTDEMLDAFAVVARPDDVAGALHARYGDVVSRLSLYLADGTDPGVLEAVVRDVARR